MNNPAVSLSDAASDASKSDSLSREPSRKALVLGGGGSTGNAWLIGVIAGLAAAGVQVSDADLIIGTSAGSTAAAQITGADPSDLYARTLVVPTRAAGAPPRRDPDTRGAETPVNHMERTAGIIAESDDPADMRRRLGAAAVELDAGSDGGWSERWRSTVAPRLPYPDWPDTRVLITAVDAANGEPVVFDRDGGVELVDAIAASTSSGFPYRIGEKLYLDGGYRRNENADLAIGCGRVLVLAPFGGRTRTPLEWGSQLATQIDELRASGSAVETIFPGAEHEHLFGPNGMDLSLRPAAAHAGLEQGLALAEAVGEFWR